jgi:hypothetical protein
LKLQATVILTATAAVVVVAPLILGIVGLVRSRGTERGSRPEWDWRLSTASALLYALAFNLTFFIQELFLVVPKALTPGLRPTLYHNNHSWQGEHELASLFQGTGALAILIAAVVCATLLRAGAGRTPTTRLFLIWMAYSGFFQSLPQVVVGAMNPQNDVGMAMDFFGLSDALKGVLALLALGAMPFLALWLARQLLALADLERGESKRRFVFLAGTLPAWIAIGLIVPFRLPREWIEVLIVPVIATVVGTVWMQAGAWLARPARAAPLAISWPIGRLLVALLALLAVFQLILRPGIQFY